MAGIGFVNGLWRVNPPVHGLYALAGECGGGSGQRYRTGHIAGFANAAYGSGGTVQARLAQVHTRFPFLPAPARRRLLPFRYAANGVHYLRKQGDPP